MEITERMTLTEITDAVASVAGRRPDWEPEAVCNQGDPELFFPEVGKRTTAAALKVCGRCPVREECLLAALSRRERYGIWGGVGRREFTRLLRKLPPPESAGRRRYAKRAA